MDPRAFRNVSARLLMVGVIGACTGAGSERSADTTKATPATVAAGDSLPTPAPIRRVAYRVPQESEVRDSTVLASIRRGRALMRATRDSLPQHVRNKLQCVSCHTIDGTQKHAMPFVGVYARFPQYRSRAGATQIIEDRVNDCFKRSMNGKPLVPESRDMRDIVAYMAFLSTGYPVGAEVDGQGMPPVPPLEGDTTRGLSIFNAKCMACHGASGEGTVVAPPLWGPDSYNVGAGMARVRTAAAFIKLLMPQNAPGSLSAQEAYDVATFVNTRPRPDFAGKETDWPRGDPPPDVAYPTRAAPKKAGAAR